MKQCIIIVGIAALALLAAPTAQGEVNFEDGRWRLDVSGQWGVYSGSTDREGDFLLSGAVEYEAPMGNRYALGLRILPLFVYDSDSGDRDDWRFGHHRRHDDDHATSVGGGLGLALRVYKNKEELRGVFLEANTHAILHDEKIAGNSSTFNFMSGLALGYQGKSGWHAEFKYSHISNAGLGVFNAGSNLLGLGVGYRF
jgi:hypothetical protein